MNKFSFRKIGGAALCTACLGLNAPAQDTANPQAVPRQAVPQQPGAQPGGPQPGIGQQQGQNPGANQQHQEVLASCLVHDNQAEIVLARMAQDKAEHANVKKFAAMMIADHQEFLGKIQKFAPHAGELSQGSSPGSSRGREAQGGNQGEQNRGTPGQGQATQNQSGNQNQDQNQDPNNRTNPIAGQQVPGQQVPGQAGQGQQGGMAMHFVSLQREVAQQCLADSEEKLSKEEDFDKCYMGMQIAMHAAMKSKLTVFSKHASGEFKQLVDAGLQTTETHLKQAESIMKELAGKSDSESEKSSERRTSERRDSTDKSENR